MRKNNIVKIGNKEIGDDRPIYIIADVGLTNGGNIARTFKLIDIAKKLNVDAIKFQLLGPDHLLGDKKITYTYPTLKNGKIKQNMFEMFKELEFTNEEWFKISQYTKKKNLEFICTSHYLGAVDILEKCNVNVHKICTWSSNHKELIKKIGKTKKPMIIDTGVTNTKETQKIFNWYKSGGGKKILVLHDFHTNDFNQMNFKAITYLKKKYSIPVGYTPQGRESDLDFLSIGLGANILEKRLTTDRSIPKNGHWKSLEPNEFKDWLKKVRNCEKSMGNETLVATKDDLEQSKKYFKSFFSKKYIFKGEKITKDKITLMRPGTGFSSEKENIILRSYAKKNIPSGTMLSSKHLI
jgi:N-acetylneuraminate synthase/N,N'-diacetyllegionaminate synthase